MSRAFDPGGDFRLRMLCQQLPPDWVTVTPETPGYCYLVLYYEKHHQVIAHLLGKHPLWINVRRLGNHRSDISYRYWSTREGIFHIETGGAGVRAEGLQIPNMAIIGDPTTTEVAKFETITHKLKNEIWLTGVVVAVLSLSIVGLKAGCLILLAAQTYRMTSRSTESDTLKGVPACAQSNSDFRHQLFGSRTARQGPVPSKYCPPPARVLITTHEVRNRLDDGALDNVVTHRVATAVPSSSSIGDSKADNAVSSGAPHGDLDTSVVNPVFRLTSMSTESDTLKGVPACARSISDFRHQLFSSRMARQGPVPPVKYCPPPARVLITTHEVRKRLDDGALDNVVTQCVATAVSSSSSIGDSKVDNAVPSGALHGDLDISVVNHKKMTINSAASSTNRGRLMTFIMAVGCMAAVASGTVGPDPGAKPKAADGIPPPDEGPDVADEIPLQGKVPVGDEPPPIYEPRPVGARKPQKTAGEYAMEVLLSDKDPVEEPDKVIKLGGYLLDHHNTDGPMCLSSKSQRLAFLAMDGSVDQKKLALMTVCTKIDTKLEDWMATLIMSVYSQQELLPIDSGYGVSQLNSGKLGATVGGLVDDAFMSLVKASQHAYDSSYELAESGVPQLEQLASAVGQSIGNVVEAVSAVGPMTDAVSYSLKYGVEKTVDGVSQVVQTIDQVTMTYDSAAVAKDTGAAISGIYDGITSFSCNLAGYGLAVAKAVHTNALPSATDVAKDIKTRGTAVITKADAVYAWIETEVIASANKDTFGNVKNAGVSTIENLPWFTGKLGRAGAGFVSNFLDEIGFETTETFLNPTPQRVNDYVAAFTGDWTGWMTRIPIQASINYDSSQVHKGAAYLFYFAVIASAMAVCGYFANKNG